MLHIYNSWPVVRFLIYSKSCRCRYKFKCILSQSVPPSPGVLSICLWLSVPLVSIVWSFSSAHVFYIIIFLLLLPVKHCAFFNVRVIIFSQTMLQSLKSFALLFFFFLIYYIALEQLHLAVSKARCLRITLLAPLSNC